jgi:PTS system mannose-specific IIB component
VSAAWVRIDDRLIHAQVLHGWAPHLAPRRIVLAHDRIAADAGLGEMYRSLGGDDYEIDVVDVATAAAQFRDAPARDGTFLVLGSVHDTRRMLESGAPLERVVLGGLHEVPGARRLAGSSIFLSARDVDDLRALLARGVQLEARDVPTAVGLRIDAHTLARVWP